MKKEKIVKTKIKIIKKIIPEAMLQVELIVV